MTYKIYMPQGGEDGVIIVISAVGDKVEFRGSPYSQWTEGESSDFFKIHSAIKRVDISRIHSDEVETVTSWHGPEYDFVHQMFVAAQQFVAK